MTMGRPKKEINQEHFEGLCAILCTQEEIAGVFDCSVDTISRWCNETYGETFAEVYKRTSSPGKVSLRRKQYQVAMSGNVSMLIWLGKQILGQKDKHEMSADEDQGFVLHVRDYADKKKNEGS